MAVEKPLSDNYFIYTLVNPQPVALDSNVEAFLQKLTGPTHIIIPGQDRSRRRLLVTLIHGNEPSGFYAVYKFIQDRIQPAVDFHILIPSVFAARAEPLFSHRMLPQHQDLNRRFKPPFTRQSESLLAQKIMALIDQLEPEAVVDLHNTSGSGPDFAVSTFIHPCHDNVLSLFTQRSVLTEIRLGALMELSTPERPIVTVECGGSHDHESHAVAYSGIKKFAISDSIRQTQAINLDVYKHPVRVELQGEVSVAYDDEALPDTQLTLVSHIEDFNFGIVDQNTVLGYCPSNDITWLRGNTKDGEISLQDYFHITAGELRPRRALKLFMVTTNRQIAQSDCLFYFVTVSDKLVD